MTTSTTSPDEPAEVPAGKHCPRCDRNALYGIECAHCGHVIITALVIKPCHPPAWSKGCCPRCLSPAPTEVVELTGWIMCAACAGHIGGPSWRERARRVVEWIDNPGELAYATLYAH